MQFYTIQSNNKYNISTFSFLPCQSNLYFFPFSIPFVTMMTCPVNLIPFSNFSVELAEIKVSSLPHCRKFLSKNVMTSTFQIWTSDFSLPVTWPIDIIWQFITLFIKHFLQLAFRSSYSHGYLLLSVTSQTLYLHCLFLQINLYILEYLCSGTSSLLYLCLILWECHLLLCLSMLFT